MKILQAIQNISISILVWAAILYGCMQLNANSECYKFNAPHAYLTSHGTLCSTIVNGTEFMAYLSDLKEKAGK